MLSISRFEAGDLLRSATSWYCPDLAHSGADLNEPNRDVGSRRFSFGYETG